MTTDDIEHRPVTRAFARELAKEEDDDAKYDTLLDDDDDDDEQDCLESGALHTPQSKSTSEREAPGAPQRRRKKEPRYATFQDADDADDPSDEANVAARRELFPAKEVAQGYVAMMAIFVLCVALALSFFQPLAHITMPAPFDKTTLSRFAATLLTMFALGLIASNGMPLEVPDASN